MGMDPTKKTRGVATEITALWMDLDVGQGCVDVDVWAGGCGQGGVGVCVYVTVPQNTSWMHGTCARKPTSN